MKIPIHRGTVGHYLGGNASNFKAEYREVNGPNISISSCSVPKVPPVLVHGSVLDPERERCETRFHGPMTSKGSSIRVLEGNMCQGDALGGGSPLVG